MASVFSFSNKRKVYIVYYADKYELPAYVGHSDECARYLRIPVSQLRQAIYRGNAVHRRYKTEEVDC